MFSIIEINMPDALKEAFSDCACSFLSPDTPEYADILYVSGIADLAKLQQQYYPKLILATHSFELSTHTTTKVQLADITLYIASVYSGEFTIVQSPAKLPAQMLADSVFRYLLKEKIQETADWCGHMSSVVHRM